MTPEREEYERERKKREHKHRREWLGERVVVYPSVILHMMSGDETRRRFLECGTHEQPP